MVHLHLQLFAYRFNEVAEEYLTKVDWIHEGVGIEVNNLLRVIHVVCSKQHFTSPRSLVFGNLSNRREILHFLGPIRCCEKALFNSATLITHILSHDRPTEEDENNENDTKSLVILFNLYIQLATSILVQFDRVCEMVETYAVELMSNVAAHLDVIRNKPVREDASADTFFQVMFTKWKYVFDYSCNICCEVSGTDHWRFEAISWLKIDKTKLVSNPIRHLCTRKHASNLLQFPADCIMPKQLRLLSPAATYLLQARETELDRQCIIGNMTARKTPFAEVIQFLKTDLGREFPEFSIQFYGSRTYEVADHKSDLDLLIVWKTDMDNRTAYLKAVSWAKASRAVIITGTISTGPLVLSIYVHAPIGLTLDLTFASPYSAANSGLIGYFFRLQPNAKKMYFLLKQWKQFTGLSERFHHHILIMLIVFHMQQNKFLPPIGSLASGPTMSKENIFNILIAEAPFLVNRTATNLLALLKSFFAYWSQFNWDEFGVWATMGHERAKELFCFRKGWNTPMVVSDYFDQFRNITANIDAVDRIIFVQACREANEVLQMKWSI